MEISYKTWLDVEFDIEDLKAPLSQLIICSVWTQFP